MSSSGEVVASPADNSLTEDSSAKPSSKFEVTEVKTPTEKDGAASPHQLPKAPANNIPSSSPPRIMINVVDTPPTSPRVNKEPISDKAQPG